MRSLFLLPVILLASAAVAQEPKGQSEGVATPEKLEKLTLNLDTGWHTKPARMGFFTPDGKQIVTVSGDHTIRFSDPLTGAQQRVLYPPGLPIVGFVEDRMAALSTDGKRLALSALYPMNGRLAPVVFILTLPEGKVEHAIPMPKSEAPVIALSPDGRRLAATSGLSTWLWDLDKPGSGKVIRKGRSIALAFAAEGKSLATLVYNGTVEIHDLEKNTSVEWKSKIRNGKLAWSPDGKTLATGRSMHFNCGTSTELYRFAG